MRSPARPVRVLLAAVLLVAFFHPDPVPRRHACRYRLAALVLTRERFIARLSARAHGHFRPRAPDPWRALDPMPARPRQLYLHLAIPGWQGRVKDEHDIELRDAMTHVTVLAIRPALVVAALANYLTQARLTAELLGTMPVLERQPTPPRPALPTAPDRGPLRAVVGVPLRNEQERRRAARAARGGKRVGRT
ncbi:MAG TPA: hypothetical protein VJ816_08285 [Gemmatimonadales bacterium]|nr:hypothetical protein [Gemmatimonadales bacterium]